MPLKRIVVNVMAEEIRLAVLDDGGEVVDALYYRPDNEQTAQHIYKGVVRNVLPGMAAAFVDIGLGQNAYLDLRRGKKPASLEKVHVGENLMVQVIKEEMLGKSAKVSADISLAGRFMVLLPYSTGIHISKRITDTKVRQRLTAMAQPYTDKGCGFILRTAAAVASPDEVAADMEFLWQTWCQLQKRYQVAKNGKEIYGDADFWLRVIRDYVRPGIEEIIVDDDDAYQRLVELIGSTKISGVRAVLHDGSEPVFKEFGIETQLEALIINSHVDLPSGGFLQIDRTEALTVIDVNSGHFTGRTGNAVETAKQVNFEAARMVARQLRLRDIGGIIVCDFIDLPKKEQQEELLSYLTSLVRQDPVKTVVCGITPLGLVELTRKRERRGAQTILFDPCERCGGTGYLLSAETVYLQIIRRLRELRRAGRLKTGIMVEAHPDVVRYFTDKVKRALSEELQRTVDTTAVATMNREAYSLLAMDE